MMEIFEILYFSNNHVETEKTYKPYDDNVQHNSGSLYE